jgi:hypothetical protein
MTSSKEFECLPRQNATSKLAQRNNQRVLRFLITLSATASIARRIDQAELLEVSPPHEPPN